MLFQDKSCQQLNQDQQSYSQTNKEDQVELASPVTLSKPNTREQTTSKRTYCNSSVKENGNRGLGTVFSFKSQILQQQEIP